MQRRTMLMAIIVTISLFAFVQVQYTGAASLKFHHTINDHMHVTGQPDNCSVMGGSGYLMYIDTDNDNVHDHDSEQVFCIPKW